MKHTRKVCQRTMGHTHIISYMYLDDGGTIPILTQSIIKSVTEVRLRKRRDAWLEKLVFKAFCLLNAKPISKYVSLPQVITSYMKAHASSSSALARDAIMRSPFKVTF